MGVYMTRRRLLLLAAASAVAFAAGVAAVFGRALDTA